MKKIYFAIIFSFAIFFLPNNSQAVVIKDRHNLVFQKLSKVIGKEKATKLFRDPRLTIHSEIYEAKPGKKKKKISYFSDEFGMFSDTSIAEGKKYLSDNIKTFERIEKAFGTEKEIIVAIIRIETNFGKNLGEYRVFNSLYTMALYTKKPKRLKMALSQLASLVKSSQIKNDDPFEKYGSWAGARGLGQCMPGSCEAYGVDFDGDGIINFLNISDAGATAANHLIKCGWKSENVRRKKKALFAYNQEREYGEAVIAYAATIKGGVNDGRKNTTNRPGKNKRANQGTHRFT